ncbi:hypothetical protein D0Q53_20585 [Salmonella enterica]|nr:hypothetical protein [Salmonella enterica]EBL0923928.1 hypothetical protein [Salmonella enterica]EFF4796125.1 hypothetical protein [Escherichia coli]EJD1942419.1 hypothetical protein [Escherichia coli]
MRIMILAVLIAILTGCSAPETPITVHMDPAIPPMPAALRRACPLVPDVEDELDMGKLLAGYSKLVDLYTQCRLSNQAKIDWATHSGL